MSLPQHGERLLADEERTRAFGAEVAHGLGVGAVVLLVGELGSGKTTLVQGLARELGVDEAVTSPTFALCNVYPCRLGELHHFDLYRLGSARELPALGLEESLSTAGATLIEWPELAAPLFRGAVLVVWLEHEGNRRRVRWRTQAGEALELRPPESERGKGGQDA